MVPVMVLAMIPFSALGLVEFVEGGKYGETAADRTVKQIRFRKAEHQVSLVLPDLGGKSEGFAETQKIVGLVGQADEAAGQTADAALQANRLLAFFLELQEEVDRALFLVAFDFDRFVGVQFVEIIELVDAEDT